LSTKFVLFGQVKNIRTIFVRPQTVFVSHGYTPRYSYIDINYVLWYRITVKCPRYTSRDSTAMGII